MAATTRKEGDETLYINDMARTGIAVCGVAVQRLALRAGETGIEAKLPSEVFDRWARRSPLSNFY